MENNHVWSVAKLTAYPRVGENQNVVFSVDWVCSATDEAGNTASLQGSQLLEITESEAFVPAGQLTEQIVLGWVKHAMTEALVSSIEANVDVLLIEAANPPVVELQLPWLTRT